MIHHKTLFERLGDMINAGLLGVLALLMLFPFYYIFAVSFTSYEEYMISELILWPKRWVLDAYSYIFSAKEFIRSIGVTVYITVVGCLANLLFTATMAYAMTRNIWGQKVFLLLVVFTFVFTLG